ncbi:DUF3068 domain-containing protein [Janibacter terrae]|uniref:DUF3068 domain-containing protein n=1 Tax=Janibacter terrae TaxID=103817 RepID=A0ABZ2FFC2_9MICO|nr:DUF3068 domain-containing protein [Kytococcus sp.]HCE60727.1 DUF3068 domain-containing protein [Janibacter terrae]
MRKFLLPAIIMGVGAFILTMGLLLRFYAYPKLAVVPLDQNTTQVVQDPNASFFDADNVKPGSGELTTTSRIIGDPEASEQASEDSGRDLAIWNSGQVSDNNGDNMPMDGSTEVYVFDRHTGEAVNCCGEARDGQEVKRDGLLVKFPFDTKPVDTYRWWDSSAGQSFPVKYEGEEDLQGMNVYRFTMEVPETKTGTRELPGSLFPKAKENGAVEAERFYSNKRTFWVDPVTGVVLDRLELQNQEFRYEGESLKALETESRFTKETVDKNVEEYKSASSLLKMVHSTLPLVLTILGVLLLLTGVLLSVLIGRRHHLDAQPAYVDDRPDPVFGMADPDAPTTRRSDLHGG